MITAISDLRSIKKWLHNGLQMKKRECLVAFTSILNATWYYADPREAGRRRGAKNHSPVLFGVLKKSQVRPTVTLRTEAARIPSFASSIFPG